MEIPGNAFDLEILSQSDAVLFETLFDHVDGKIGDVDAHPTTVEFFRHRHRSTTAAERIQHHVAFVAAGPDDTLQEGFGLLGGVAIRSLA